MKTWYSWKVFLFSEIVFVGLGSVSRFLLGNTVPSFFLNISELLKRCSPPPPCTINCPQNVGLNYCPMYVIDFISSLFLILLVVNALGFVYFRIRNGAKA